MKAKHGGGMVSSGRDIPMSYAPSVFSGMQVKFGQGRTQNCIRLMIRFRVAQVMVVFANYPTIPIRFVFNGNASNDLPLLYNNVLYYPSYITTLCNLFDYNFTNKCKISYKPRVTVNNDASFSMAYIQDPAWFESHSQLLGGYATPSETAITSISNACTDVSYRACSVSASPDKTKKFYNAGPNTGGQIYYPTNTTADLRNSVNGSFMIAGTVITPPTANVVLGDVYMDLDVEFCEMSTAINATTSLMSSDSCRKCRSIESLQCGVSSSDVKDSKISESKINESKINKTLWKDVDEIENGRSDRSESPLYVTRPTSRVSRSNK